MASNWHWRAETSARRPGKVPCPTNTWTVTHRALHDALSAELLEDLPLPWLVVAGSCPKVSYRKTLSTQARRLSLSLSTVSTLEFDLDFRHTRLKRITTCVPHPAASFFQRSTSTCNSIVQDVAFNFLLWIHHRDFTPNSFAAAHIQIPVGVPVAAPLKELYGYRGNEKKLNQMLTLEQYDSCFLTWARKYLGEDPEAVLASGRSLAGRIIDQLGKAIHSSYNKPGKSVETEKKNRINIAKRYGYSHKRFWNGHSVQVTQKGKFSIFLSPDRPSLQLSGGVSLYREIKNHTDPVTIHFSEDDISLKCGVKLVYQIPRNSFQGTDMGDLWIVQMQNEIAHGLAIECQVVD
ncbi:hypothetical protein EJ08DRAFT_147804 [Tothia fuscella]|uniref:Uncharacterized protein n=1 Tax=Tothia fuscella TaxID=1048955 RepID=A0A9P4P1F3_9PEZI|nr:hypothetical protein EJ08DRAFT_147804 [Tothia fuscella]